MKTLALSVAGILLIVSYACKPSSDDYDALLKKTAINPAFEKLPPIASDISFEILEKPGPKNENIRLIADFSKQKIGSPYLAINISDTKMVLRDDGKGADKTAGDNKYALLLKEDLSELGRTFNERLKTARTLKELPVFQNRSIQTLKLEPIGNFDFEKIGKGKIIPFPKDLVRVLKNLTLPKRALMITDVQVVEDESRTFNPCSRRGNPRGAWTFGELMRQMASPHPGAIASDATTSTFVRNWLNTWMANQTVNGESLPARTSIQNLITDWENKSSVGRGGILKMEFAPFKLIAIVNRLDMRGNSGYGFSDGGEGRLVFEALNSNCSTKQFTVIFEYGINKKSCNAVSAFATEWNNLNNLVPGSTAYNSALQQITDQFTKCGTNPAKTNQNSINQIRTNEFALGSPWELREFNLLPAGQLALVTVKQEPAQKYNAKINNPDVVRLVSYINGLSSDIENNRYTIPEQVQMNPGTPTPTTSFLGGKSHVPSPSSHWNGAMVAGPAFITSDKARHVFSLNTCSGCHGGETGTVFLHINTANFGSEASLSGFLTGITVTDPAGRPSGAPATRTFNDLEERRLDFNLLVGSVCIQRPLFELVHKLTFDPIRMVH